MTPLLNVVPPGHHTLQQSNCISGASVLEQLGIDNTSLRSLKPRWKRSHYRAVMNWLTKYSPPLDAPNIERVRGFLEAFQHLCHAEAWDHAYTVLVAPLPTPTHDDLGAQLGVWGYYQEQALVYRSLYQKLDSHVDALCLKGLGAARHALNDFEDARHCYETSYRLFEAQGQSEEVAWLLHSFGQLEADQGEGEQARPYYEQALQRFRTLHHFSGIARVLNDLARLEANRGAEAIARHYFEESLEIHYHRLATADQLGCAWAHYDFGWFLAGQEEYREARHHSKKALEMFRGVEHRLGMAWALYSLGILKVNTGQYGSARVCTHKALDLFRTLGDRVGIAWACHILGRVAFMTQEYTLMHEYYRDSLRIHQEQHNRPGIAYALEGFAYWAIALNNPQGGVRLLSAATALREALGFPLPRPDRIAYDWSMASARAQLTPASFDLAWAAGKALSLEQAMMETHTLTATIPSAGHYTRL